MALLEQTPRYRPSLFNIWPMTLLTRRTVTIGVVVSFVFLVLHSNNTFTRQPVYNSHSSGHEASPPPVNLVVDPAATRGGRASDRNAISRLGNFTESDRPLTMGLDPLCAGFPDVSSIAIVMKTGASESFGKLPTQLLTAMRCVPDLVVFSDKEETVAGVKVRNALEDMRPDAQEGNPQFDLYRTQRDCIVDQEHCTRDVWDKGEAGWNLDKYKNIHMAEKIWKLRPGRDWYFFIDADTYVLWNTLVAWLGRHDATKKHYLGSVALINEFPFSHGGSGYILSRPALADLVEKHPGVAQEYDFEVRHTCCGDYMFSKAMKDKTDLDVTQVWPTLNGASFWSAQFGPGFWCAPLATMHHMSAEEVSVFWEWELKHYGDLEAPTAADGPRPILMRDVYRAFLSSRITASVRRDWDNLADDGEFRAEPPHEDEWGDHEKAAHLGPDQCRDLCESRDGCFQWRYVHGDDGKTGDGRCHIGWSIRLGNPVGRDRENNKEKQTSGWMLDRIESFVRSSDCEKGVEWKMSDGR